MYKTFIIASCLVGLSASAGIGLSQIHQVSFIDPSFAAPKLALLSIENNSSDVNTFRAALPQAAPVRAPIPVAFTVITPVAVEPVIEAKPEIKPSEAQAPAASFPLSDAIEIASPTTAPPAPLVVDLLGADVAQKVATPVQPAAKTYATAVRSNRTVTRQNTRSLSRVARAEVLKKPVWLIGVYR